MNYKENKTLNYDQAKEKALRLLEFRSHSEKELKIKLKRAGANDEDIERLLEFLREYNFVNDEQYAVRYAKDLQNLKKLGKNRIKAELFNKGIPQEFVENALGELDEADDDILSGLIKKKLGGNFDRKNKDKTIRYFLYRGYSFEEIKHCIEMAEAEGFENGI